MKNNTDFSVFKYENENRLIFDHGITNPRNEMGKMGIRLHEGISHLFYNTVTLHAKKRGEEQARDFYLNRKSAISWINAQSPQKDQLPLTAHQVQVIDSINSILSKKVHWEDHQLLHQGRPSHRPLSKWVDKVKGIYWEIFWKISTACWQLFRLRFFILKSERETRAASEARANAIFWNSVSTVPAYGKHVGNQLPSTFAQIPITDKASYIKPYTDSQEIQLTMKGGKLPFDGQCDTSTGTTGKPSMWIRGTQERAMVKKLIHYATRVVMGTKPLFFINAFALGPWATGMTTSNALFDRAVTFSTGPDIEKILDVLKQFPPEKHPDRKYVIAGYPPFMKDLVEEARKQGLDLNKYGITAVVGGEAIADGIRMNILGKNDKGEKILPGFDAVYSSYGASDLDINIGYESPFEQQLSDLCKKHPEFAAELYGSNEPVPSIFHYDPLNYYIETDADQQLIFSCVRNDRVSPRIRYNLHDRGKVIPLQNVLAIAQKHGIQLPVPATNLPLLFVWGRENTINFRGAKVPIQHLQEAIHNVLGANQIHNLAFKEIEGQNGTRIIIMLEKSKDCRPIIPQVLRNQLIAQLKELNQDFKYQAERVQNPEQELPQLEICDFGTSPMSNQDPHRKKQYIFKTAS